MRRLSLLVLLGLVAAVMAAQSAPAPSQTKNKKDAAQLPSATQDPASSSEKSKDAQSSQGSGQKASDVPENEPPPNEKDYPPQVDAPQPDLQGRDSQGPTPLTGGPQQKAPRAEANPGESSSKDHGIDLSAPKDDVNHEGDEESVAEATGIHELKKWDPHKADKHFEVGQYYLKQKNYKAAISRFREALTYQSNHAEALYLLGTSLEKDGQRELARRAYKHYLEVLPHGPHAHEAHEAVDRVSEDPDTAKK